MDAYWNFYDTYILKCALAFNNLIIEQIRQRYATDKVSNLTKFIEYILLPITVQQIVNQI